MTYFTSPANRARPSARPRPLVDHYDDDCTSSTRTDAPVFAYVAGTDGRDGTYLIDGAIYSHGAAWRHFRTLGLSGRAADLFLADARKRGIQ